MKKQMISAAGLLLAAFIWGIAFVAQSVGMDYVEPFTFNGVRCFIGGFVLIPLVLFLNKKDSTKRTEEEKKQYRKYTVLGGICCGIFLAAATSLQQIGLVYTSAGKAGFITALYIVLVPILGIFLKKKVAPIIWISSAIAITGFYMLSISGQVSISKGDIYVLICAVVFSFHILTIDYFSPKGNAVAISCIQFLTAGIICTVVMFLVEQPRIADILEAYIPLLYAGVLSSGVAYTLQIVGQKNLQPTIAALIMSLESVFSALAGWAILNQKLTNREIFGCILVFAAVILAQLPQKQKAD